MGDYKVTEVSGAGEPFGQDKDWGPLIPWRFKVEGDDATITWNRKPGSAGPSVGETISGDLTDNGQWGKKFKKAASGGFNRGGQSPEVQRSIVRQHSQGMALQYMAAKGITEFKLDDDFRKVIDWFVKDAGR